MADFSSERNYPVTDSAVSDLFDILSKNYPEVVILAENQSGTRDVRQIAAELGQGTYVVVSQEFLARMGRSREDFEKCRTALTEALRRLSSGGKEFFSQGTYLTGSKAVSWQVPKQQGNDIKETLEAKVAAEAKKIAEALKQAGAGAALSSNGSGLGANQPAKKENGSRIVVSYSTMEHFSSMARAGSKGEVKKVMSDVHRSISKLRLASVYGDEKERLKARKAMRSLQKLLARGSRKIRKLDQEELLAIQKKHAQKARKEKRVRQIKLEMKKRRSARKGADYRLIREGISDTYRILGSRDDRREYELEREMNLDFSGGVSMDAGAAAGAGIEFTAAEVVVSSEVEF